jgi:hypothetical protein
MSTDSQPIPTVTLATLFATGDANYVTPQDKGSEHNLLSIVTDATGQSQTVVAANQPGTIIVKSNGDTQKFPFVSKSTVSTYDETGEFNTNIPVEKTPEFQQTPVVSAVQSTDGETVSLGYQQTVKVNETGVCTDEPWQAVATPVRTAVLNQSTNKTLGHLTYPPLAPDQIGIGKGHNVVKQGNTTFTIDTLVTMPRSALPDNGPDEKQATSLITVNRMDEALLSGNRTLLDTPQLSLQNFGAVTETAVLPRGDGHWDLAVMGYAKGNVQPQILVVQDALSQQGVIDVSVKNPAVSIIKYQKHPNDDSNPDNRIVQYCSNGRRYLAVATQNQFYCDQDRPLWLIDVDELEATSSPLTLGDETAGVTQIVLSSNDSGDCLGLHALNVVADGTENLAVSSIENNEGEVDRIYIVKTLPESIVAGTVNQIAIQDTTDFIIANDRDDSGHKECSSMSLQLKGSNPFVPPNNPLLASRCASGGEDQRILIIDFDAARELAYENVTDTDSTGFEDSDSTGMNDADFTEKDSLSIREIVAQKEQRNTWLSAGLGVSTFFSSAATVASGLLGAATSPAAIDTNSPVQVIDCDTPPEEPGNFPVVLTCALGAGALLVAGGLFSYVIHKCNSRSAEADTENGQEGPTTTTPLINHRN